MLTQVRPPERLSPAWCAALDAYQADLTRRAVAAKTQRAYAIDTEQFARWAGTHGVDPAAVDVRVLRRYIASLSERGQAPATVARKLAALRGLFRSQIEIGARDENPAELLHSPKRAQRLPRVLKPAEVTALLDRIPATTPLQLRDRAMFELAYASGLRAEELVIAGRRVARFRRRIRSRRGEGRQDPARAGGRARTCGPRALPAQRPPHPDGR